jgi:Na+-transporting NADH:ubiquinone oxidoreductase subunit NqrB
MYRLTLYCLIGLVAIATIFGYFGLISYQPMAILVSTAIIVVICLITNYIFAYVFKAPNNIVSVCITALILVLIIAPPLSISDIHYLILAGWASMLAMASKYIFAIHKKHLFNPVAIAVVLTALVINQSANWWVGTTALMPFVLVGGLLIVRKLKRSDLVIAFLVAAFLSTEFFGFLKGSNLLLSAQRILLSSPLLFFAFIMLTEPLTVPLTKMKRIVYGIFVGLIFTPAIHLWSLYSTPELALVVGNALLYLFSFKGKILINKG